MKNRLAAVILLATSAAHAAPPTIRSWAHGIMFTHAHNVEIAEAWTTRAPGTVWPPFRMVGTYAWFGFQEQVRVRKGGMQCRWVIDVTADLTDNGSVWIGVDSELAVGHALGVSSGVQTLIYSPPVNPCDYDLSGGMNVLDFSKFLNERPDWNGDGVCDADDLNQFMGLCGS